MKSKARRTREKDLGKKGGRSKPMSFCVSNVPICLAFYQMWACLCNKNFWTRYQNPFIFIQILIKDISCWPIVSHGRRWTAGWTDCQSNSWGKFNMYTRKAEKRDMKNMSYGNIWKYLLSIKFYILTVFIVCKLLSAIVVCNADEVGLPLESHLHMKATERERERDLRWLCH